MIVKNSKVTPPCVSEEIYSNLPQFFKPLLEPHDEGISKDAYFYGLLVVLSSILPNVFIDYRGDGEVYPSLFLIFIADSANGKKNFKRTLKLLIHVNEEIEEYNKTEFEKRKVSKKYQNTPHNFRTHKVPGNNTEPQIFRQLVNNNGVGLIHENELKTLGNSINSRFGNFADLLTTCFDHDLVDRSRLMDEEVSSIKKPKLSIGSTGTPDQLVDFFPNTQDGLANRFISIYYEKEFEFNIKKDPHKVMLKREAEDLAAKSIKEIYDYCNSSPKVEFNFTEAQEDSFNKEIASYLESTRRNFGKHFDGFVIRHAVNMTRILLIISFLRKWESREEEIKGGYFEDKDFETVMKLSRNLRKHLEFVYLNLPGNKRVVEFRINSEVLKLISDLPRNKIFSFSDLTKFYEKAGIPKTTFTDNLKKAISMELISKIDRDKYIVNSEEDNTSE